MKTKNDFSIRARILARAMILVLLVLGVFLLGSLTTPGSAAAVATRTPTRKPTLTPKPKAASFSVNSANKTKPGDVLHELFFGGKGGGEGDGQACNRSSATPYLDGPSSRKGELFTDIYIVTCGWPDGEQLDVRLQYPNGKVVRDQTIAYEDTGVIYGLFSFMPAWTDPTGIYRVTLDGPSGQVSADVNVVRPTAPRVLVFGKGNVQLFHFSPNENVRLLAYSYCGTGDTACLKAWQSFQVDRQGNLSLKLGSDLDGLGIFIIGEKSGELEGEGGLSTYEGSYKMIKQNKTDSPVLVSSCPGAPSQRLKVGWSAFVCTKVDRVKVRQQPKRSAPEIIRLEPGTRFWVIDGPACSDNWSWWEVEWQDGQTGWVAEGGDNTDPYFICPDF